jgi:putative hydroxymethylpyrimidine transporter CytX
LEQTKSRGLFLLWLGAAISIAEIVTGTLIAPLGIGLGLTAIIIGHLIGCFIFLLPAAYISAKQSKSAIQVADIAFGKIGILIFSFLNALQLLGWTAVMIVNAQLSVNGITKHLFGFHSVALVSIVIAALIIIWLLFNHDWLFRINNIVVILLAIGSLLIIWAIFDAGQLVATPSSASMTFGSAIELNVTMALSWLPLIGDYTQQSKRPFLDSFVSSAGYFIGSCIMFIIGLVTVIVTGESDFATVLAHSNLGILALLIIVFSTVTTTFMDAYSAATNIKNIFPNFKTNLTAIIITLIGLLIAIFISMTYYQNFLYTIGAVFAPLFAIIFATFFLVKRKLPIWISFVWWIIGFMLYSYVQKLDLILGTTLPLLIIMCVGYYLTSLLIKKNRD